MLFGREFMPEGAGVSPDAPRKKGVARLVEILSRDLDGIFLSGLLALLACVPAAALIGLALWLGSLPLCLLAAVAAGWLVGPALTCLYDTILRALRDEPGYWWHTYKRAWKQNFRSSLVPGIVFTVLWALLAWSAFVLPQMTEISVSFAGVLLLDAVLLLTLGSYFWMQNALFACSAFQKTFQLYADVPWLSAADPSFCGSAERILASDGVPDPSVCFCIPAHRAVGSVSVGRICRIFHDGKYVASGRADP